VKDLLARIKDLEAQIAALAGTGKAVRPKTAKKK
jgi:hypothetical protein